MGWKSPPAGPVDTYSASAPMAVVPGKSSGGRPFIRRAASSAASIPLAQDSTYPSTPVIWPAKAMRGQLLSR